MSRARNLSNAKNTGLFFYMRSQPRSFDELLFFSKTSCDNLKRLLNLGLSNGLLIKDGNKYKVSSNYTEVAKRAFFDYGIINSNTNNKTIANGKQKNNNDLPKQANSPNKPKQKVTKNQKLSKIKTVNPFTHSGQLDLRDEELVRESSSNNETGRGRKKSKEWNRQIALDFEKLKADLLKNKSKRPDPTDRFRDK